MTNSKLSFDEFVKAAELSKQLHFLILDMHNPDWSRNSRNELRWQDAIDFINTIKIIIKALIQSEHPEKCRGNLLRQLFEK